MNKATSSVILKALIFIHMDAFPNDNSPARALSTGASCCGSLEHTPCSMSVTQTRCPQYSDLSKRILRWANREPREDLAKIDPTFDHRATLCGRQYRRSSRELLFLWLKPGHTHNLYRL